VRTLHSYWAYVVLFANLIVGVWGLWRLRRHGAGSRPFWIALGVAWAAIYIQGLLGLAIFNDYKPPFKHHFYGFLFAIITIAVLPLRAESERTRLRIFSWATLFIGIVAVRAVVSL
jgi:hypothetical protein